MKKKLGLPVLLILSLFLSATAMSAQAQNMGAPAVGGLASAPTAAPAHEAVPGSGELRLIEPEGKAAGVCPLKHTDVQADVIGQVARVRVRQAFSNSSARKIEAVYVFPLPEGAAVDDMTMTVGARRIVAQIKQREEARAIYNAARAMGNVASLLDQERANIFTQSVTNIEPGAEVQIEIGYTTTLRQEEGAYQFVFPMVVGPRFIPGKPIGRQGTGMAPDTVSVPDASQITPPVTPPGTRAGHDISLAVTIDAPMGLSEVKSKLHGVEITPAGAGRVRVALKNQNEIPNKDFILSYYLGAKALSNAFYVYEGAQGKFFMLVLQPPLRVAPAEAVPKEMIFVIDRSGSMNGLPIEKAKETMKRCIEGMNPRDTFDLISFSNNVEDYMGGPVPNTPENRARALERLAALTGNGGTYMVSALDKALGGARQPGRVRTVCFMTDGFVGNDMEVMDLVKKNAEQSRMFSFGVGNSVNRYLLEGIARLGRGAAEFVTLSDQADQAAARFVERIQSPVLTDIQVDWGGLAVDEVYPARIPDVFSHTPILIFGRLKGAAKGTITLKGQTGKGPYTQRIEVAPTQDQTPHEVLPSLWARAKVEELMERDLTGAQQGLMNAALKEEITGLGINYRIMTQFTSFVAVEEMTVTVAGEPQKIAVPVEMPEGVSYEGVFGAKMMQGQFGGGGGGGFGGGGSSNLGVFGPNRASASGRGGRGGNMNNYNGPVVSATTAPATAPAAAPPATAAKRPALSSSAAQPQAISLAYASGDPLKPAEKIAEPLRGLAAKVTKDGREGTLTLGKLKVVGYKIDVMITLKDLSEATLKALKEAGFTRTAESNGARLLIGTIDVRKLEELAKLDAVLKVGPVGV